MDPEPASQESSVAKTATQMTPDPNTKPPRNYPCWIKKMRMKNGFGLLLLFSEQFLMRVAHPATHEK
jgi:hypothetical protein